MSKPSLLAFLLAIGLACHPLSQQHADAEWEARDEQFRNRFAAWVGCYDVRAGFWTGDTRRVPARFVFPSHIRLDVARHDSYMLLRPLPDSSSGYQTAGWRASGPDPARESLFLIWQHDPHLVFGPSIHGALTPAGNSYQGTLRPATDIRGSELPYRDVTLTPVACNGEFKPPAT